LAMRSIRFLLVTVMAGMPALSRGNNFKLHVPCTDGRSVFTGGHVIPASEPGETLNGGVQPHSETFAAITPETTIVAWGPPDSGSESAPTDSGYVSIAPAGKAFCALKSNGRLSAWGKFYLKNNGQDGQDASTGIPTDSGYVSIQSSKFKCVAMKKDGSVRVWGAPFSQCTSLFKDTPTDAGYSAVFPSECKISAMKPDGSFKCWGKNANYCPTDKGYVKVITHGVDDVAALKADGTLAVWQSFSGSNGEGWNGVHRTNADEKYKSVHCHTHGCTALSKKGGTLLAWGEYSSQAPTDAGYVQVAPGRSNVVARKADGTFSTWGRFTVTLPTDSGYVDIYSSGEIFAAVKADGSITLLGSGGLKEQRFEAGHVQLFAAGQMFAALKQDGSITHIGNDGTHCPKDSGYVEIHSVSDAFVALKRDGTMSLWGRGGDGTTWGPGGNARVKNVPSNCKGCTFAMSYTDDGCYHPKKFPSTTSTSSSTSTSTSTTTTTSTSTTSTTSTSTSTTSSTSSTTSTSTSTTTTTSTSTTTTTTTATTTITTTTTTTTMVPLEKLSSDAEVTTQVLTSVLDDIAAGSLDGSTVEEIEEAANTLLDIASAFMDAGSAGNTTAAHSQSQSDNTVLLEEALLHFANALPPNEETIVIDKGATSNVSFVLTNVPVNKPYVLNTTKLVEEGHPQLEGFNVELPPFTSIIAPQSGSSDGSKGTEQPKSVGIAIIVYEAQEVFSAATTDNAYAISPQGLSVKYGKVSTTGQKFAEGSFVSLQFPIAADTQKKRSSSKPLRVLHPNKP